MKKVFVFIFCAICLMFGNANADTIYNITDFRVSKYDKDATTARKIAMTQGQRKAFNTVLERMGIDSSNGILVTDEEISQMIRSMQIKNERITNNSYSATLTLEFSPDYIQYTLDKYKISKSSPRLDSYLIIPVLKENGETYMWSKNNKWFDAFKNNLKTAKNIFLVRDDFSSRNAIDIDDLDKKPTFTKFKNIADIYNVNNIVLVNANYNKGGDMIYIKINILNENVTKSAHMNYEVENINSIKNDFNGAALKIVDYINSLNKKIEEDETSDLNIPQSEQGTIFVFVPISSIVDFNVADATLKSVRNIKDLKLKMLTKNMATYLVRYRNNNLQDLVESLEASGFSVNEKRDGLYIFL